MGEAIFHKARIDTIAAVTPKKRIPLSSFAESFGEDEIRKVTRLTGIEEVTVAGEGKTSSDYCYEAAMHLFRERGISGADLDGLVYVTEMPDHIVPATAPSLQHRLGLGKNTINLDLRCSCAGFVYGLFQASMLIETGVCKTVLLLAGITASKLVNPLDRALLMVTGDAACAALVVKSDEDTPAAFSFYVDGGGMKSIYVPAGGSRMPIEKGVTDVLEIDEDGNGHTLENLRMDGMAVMVFAVRAATSLIKNVMQAMNWTPEDVDLFAVHQANKLIVDRIAKGVKANPAKMPVSIQHTGNCGLVSIPLVLCNEFPGVHPELKKVVACGFGSGLIASAGALDISKTKILKTVESKE